jgi:hypothetical protein
VLPQIILGAFALLAFVVCASSAVVAMLPSTKKAARDAAWRIFRLAWVSFVVSAATAVWQLYASGRL